MPEHIKDSRQKEKAVKYCLVNGMLPYLEVNVNNRSEISDEAQTLTDIDVLGVRVRHDGSTTRTIFDCKTERRMSPVNRAFWAAGVLKYTSCDEAFVILERRAVEAHRLSAKVIAVHLFDEEMFDKYAEASNIDYLAINSYCSKIETWRQSALIFEKWKTFGAIGRHLNENVPLSTGYDRSFRKLLSLIRASNGEFDPSKDDHMAVYAQVVTSAVFLLTPLVADFRNLFDPKQGKDTFEMLLRYYVWGGRENWLVLQKIRRYAVQNKDPESGEFELYEWGRFMELFRLLLDAPTMLAPCCLPSKELAFRYIAPRSEADDKKLAVDLAENNRIRQFLFAVSDYLVRAARLPKDIHSRFEEDINVLLKLVGQ